MTQIDPARAPLVVPNRFSDPLRRGLMDLVGPAAERALGLPALNALYHAVVAALGDSTDPVDIADRVMTTFDLACDVDDADLAHIPADGPVIVVANHPYGGLEGILLASILQRVRPDTRLLVNYLLGVMPALRPLFFFVDPFGRPDAASRNRAATRHAIEWVRRGGVLGVFPAGEVSHATFRRPRVLDPRWSDSMARIAMRTGATVVPVFFDGHNGLRFQLAGLIHPRLRTAMLPRELLNKQHGRFRVVVGRPITPERIASFDHAPDLTSYLRVRTYLLKGRARRRPDTPALPGADAFPPVAPPHSACDVIAEVRGLPATATLLTGGMNRVLLVRASEAPLLMHEIGREREIAFRAVGEGTGRPLDLDRFDESYRHLVVWNDDADDLVGAYRLGLTDEIVPSRGLDGLYTRTLFTFDERLIRQIDPAIELGRSFVRQRYQRNHASLMLLWKGIGAFIAREPRYRMLFGPVSISNDFHSMSKQLLISFLQAHRFLPALARLVRPMRPVRLPPLRDWDPRTTSLVTSDIEHVDDLIREIESEKRSTPILLRQYLKLNANLLAFSVDPEFGEVVDGLMVVDLMRVDPRILSFYMGRDAAATYRAAHGG